MKYLHNRKAKKCCSQEENLIPVLLHIGGGCAYTHFCGKCGWLSLSTITTPEEMGQNGDTIDDVVLDRIEYITYPLIDFKTQKEWLGQEDKLTGKEIIPFKKDEEKPSKKEQAN